MARDDIFEKRDLPIKDSVQPKVVYASFRDEKGKLVIYSNQKK